MNSFKYFVSYNYDFRNVKRTLKILQTLDVTGHKLLYGVNYVGNTGISDNTVREIKEIYDRYVSDKSVFGDNKNISGIPELIGRVIKKDTETDVEFASEKEQWAYISALDEEKAFKYKYLVALMLKIFAGKFGYRRREILTYDKIRFCGEKDISFSTSYGICGTPDERNLFIWFEIDAENDLFCLIIQGLS